MINSKFDLIYECSSFKSHCLFYFGYVLSFLILIPLFIYQIYLYHKRLKKTIKSKKILLIYLSLLNSLCNNYIIKNRWNIIQYKLKLAGNIISAILFLMFIFYHGHIYIYEKIFKWFKCK